VARDSINHERLSRGSQDVATCDDACLRRQGRPACRPACEFAADLPHKVPVDLDRRA